MPPSKVLLTVCRTVGNAEVKAEVLIATHTTFPHVLIPCYC